jgi:hypothetical protein
MVLVIRSVAVGGVVMYGDDTELMTAIRSILKNGKLTGRGAGYFVQMIH